MSFTHRTRRLVRAGQPFEEHGIERPRIDRLGDEIVHAGLQAHAPVFVEGVGSHRQDRRRRSPENAANGARCVEPVHLGHLDVHQHEVVACRARLVEGFAPVARGIDLQADAVQQQLGDLQIDLDVVGQEDLHAAALAPQFFLEVDAVLINDLRHDTTPVFQTGAEPERAAASGRALDARVAAHQLGQAARDRQAEAAAAELARDRWIGLLERLEQALHFFRIDADAGVLDFKADQQATLVGFNEPGAHDDLAALGEFDGVGGEVEQRLTQPRRVAVQPDRGVAKIDHDAEPLLARFVDDHRAYRADDRIEREVRVFDLHLAGVDLGEVENILDQFEQMRRRGVDLLQPIELPGRWIGIAQQMRESDDGVHRRADLVAHVGEESALGDIRRLGPVLCLGKLCGAFDDQRFEVIPVLVEFFLKPALFGDVLLDADVVRDGAVRLADRGEHGRFDEHAAVLPAVMELAFPHLAALERFPHRRVGPQSGFAG